MTGLKLKLSVIKQFVRLQLRYGCFDAEVLQRLRSSRSLTAVHLTDQTPHHQDCFRQIVSCYFWANQLWTKNSLYISTCPRLICPENSNNKYISMCLDVSEVNYDFQFWPIFLHTNKENGTGGLSYKSIWTLLEPFPLAILVLNDVKLPKTREEDHLS